MTDPSPPSEPPKTHPEAKAPTARQVKARAEWAEFGAWKKAKAGKTPAASPPTAPATGKATPPPQPRGQSDTTSPNKAPALTEPITEWFDHLNLGFLRDMKLPKFEFNGKE